MKAGFQVVDRRLTRIEAKVGRLDHIDKQLVEINKTLKTLARG